MDEIDKKILQLLQQDAKIQHYKIAEKLGIGTSTVHFRIKKMIENKIILSFSAIVDSSKVGYEAKAWVGLNVEPKRLDIIAEKLAKYPQVQVVATAAGHHDIILQILAKDEKELWHFINRNIKTIEGVDRDFHVSSFLDIYKNLCYKIKIKTEET